MPVALFSKDSLDGTRVVLGFTYYLAGFEPLMDFIVTVFRSQSNFFVGP